MFNVCRACNTFLQIAFRGLVAADQQAQLVQEASSAVLAPPVILTLLCSCLLWCLQASGQSQAAAVL